MCLRNEANPGGYNDIVVLDEESITQFDPNGVIRAELRQAYVSRFRGLDYNYELNQFVTTEKNRLGIKVVFFSLLTGIERWVKSSLENLGSFIYEKFAFSGN